MNARSRVAPGLHTLCRRALLLLAALSLAGAFFSASAEAAVHEEVTSHRFELPDGRRFLLTNLAGSITIQAADGDAIEIEARTVAEAGSDAEAESLAGSIEFQVDESDRQVAVRTLYPVDDYDVYIYSPEGTGRYSSRARYQDRDVLVTSRHRNGVRLHTDFLIRVPDRARVKIENMAGRIEAGNVVADLFLDTGAGSIDVSGVTGGIWLDTGSAPVRVRDHEGRVAADTGSGSVLFEDVAGDASADTGSGSVTMRGIQGDVHADTGSGGVEFENVTAGRIHADTGSGSVTLQDAAGSLLADTGSGSVRARNFFAGERVEVDTGSGSVSLAGNLAEVRHLIIDTGSGSVRLSTVQLPSFHLEASAGSGNVDIDVPAVSAVRSSGRHHFEGNIGDGEGTAVIDTGSGGISLRMQ